MSIFFFDSMAHYNSAAQMESGKWAEADTGPIASSGAFGYYGVRPSSDGEGAMVNFPAKTTIELSGYINPVAQYGKLIEFHATTGPQCSISLFSDGTLKAYLAQAAPGGIDTGGGGGLVLAASAAGAVPMAIHSHIHVKVVFSQAAGSITIKVNGVQKLNVSGIDNCYQAAAECTQIRIFGSGTSNVADCVWSHFALGDASGDIPGRPRVQAVFPDGAGNYSQWNLTGAATYHGAVGEQFPDEDATYAHESTVNDRSSATYSNFLSTTDTILAVAVVPRARTDDGAAREIKTFVRAGGVDYDHADSASVPGSYGYLQQIYQVNPATGVAWTPAEVNAIEAGIKVVS